MFFGDNTDFMFGMVVSVFYICDIAILLSVILIIYRMLRVRFAQISPAYAGLNGNSCGKLQTPHGAL